MVSGGTNLLPSGMGTHTPLMVYTVRNNIRFCVRTDEISKHASVISFGQDILLCIRDFRHLSVYGEMIEEEDMENIFCGGGVESYGILFMKTFFRRIIL